MMRIHPAGVTETAIRHDGDDDGGVPTPAAASCLPPPGATRHPLTLHSVPCIDTNYVHIPS